MHPLVNLDTGAVYGYHDNFKKPATRFMYDKLFEHGECSYLTFNEFLDKLKVHTNGSLIFDNIALVF